MNFDWTDLKEHFKNVQTQHLHHILLIQDFAAGVGFDVVDHLFNLF